MGKIHNNTDEKSIILPSGEISFPNKPNNLRNDPHPGDLCPKCQVGHLDYDGLLNLVCQDCGFSLVGCST